MSIFEAFVMGVIQGATEFLPVSSSGHLLLFSRITGTEPSLAFDIILHLGTLAAVLIAFRTDFFALIKRPFSKPTLMLLLSTAVSAAIVFALRGTVERTMTGALLPLFFCLSALAMTAATFLPKPKPGPVDLPKAIAIGAAQGLAAFPGLSRSGLTVSTGALVGVEKNANATYCFLLSAPMILGSAAIGLLESGLAPVPAPCLAVGFVAAFASGLIALVPAKKLFAKLGLLPFALYLALLSTFIVINDAFLHLF